MLIACHWTELRCLHCGTYSVAHAPGEHFVRCHHCQRTVSVVSTGTGKTTHALPYATPAQVATESVDPLYVWLTLRWDRRKKACAS